MTNPPSPTLSERLHFRAQHGEALVCSGSLGGFALAMRSGTGGVLLPTPERWAADAPAWARPFYRDVHAQLAAWCASERIPLFVDATAAVLPA